VNTPRPDLTRRQVEIIAAIANGHTIGQIAARHGVAIKTVDRDCRVIRAALCARSQAHMVFRAYDLDIITSDTRGRAVATTDVYDPDATDVQIAAEGGHTLRSRPLRRRTIELLATGPRPLTAAQIADRLGIAARNVQRHLSILRESA
jgi:DNA-binding CsgD family transcriptional regulator